MFLWLDENTENTEDMHEKNNLPCVMVFVGVKKDIFLKCTMSIHHKVIISSREHARKEDFYFVTEYPKMDGSCSSNENSKFFEE